MKKTISILILGALPAFAMANGAHSGTHEMSGGHATKNQHHSHEMGGMSHDRHESEAGQPGNPGNVSRTIHVTMDDNMRFTPDQLKFKAGETVRFAVHNNGKIRHEMVIGSLAELKKHMTMMRSKPAMQHTESNMVALAPEQNGEIIWQFDKPGIFSFACLVPNHLEAGMQGRIEVR